MMYWIDQLIEKVFFPDMAEYGTRRRVDMEARLDPFINTDRWLWRERTKP